MKLKYVGKYEPIALMVKQPDGTMGISVKRNETFECSPNEAAAIMSRFNEQGMDPKFIEPDEAPRVKMKEPSRKA